MRSIWREVARRVVAKLVQAEQDRIIKLLEQDVCPDWTISCCDGACAAYKDAIALIKGEQK